ncbi:MAG: bifunctional aminoglycoside phosphotransferase/ATP-binding protein [Gammaproteobacteria bacterium]
MHTLIDKLRDTALYMPPPDCVELLETHISWILLAGHYAYKIKKPVDFGFLDFSTLEKRRFFCFEELRLNRRLAPDMYLQVVKITGTADRPELNGSGTVIEYAVKMRRFAETALFDRMLAENRLTARHIDLLAETIAAFHALIPRSDSSDGHGSATAIHAAALENFSHIQPLADTAEIDRIRTWTEAQFETLQPLMQARKSQGFVRECHGDLHLGNIVLLNDRPVPFDCIEFSENLRWIDVISEIAFCMMDLHAKNHRAYAYRLLNRYLAATGDYSGCRLLRYYLVYRGMVRAKIALLSLAQSTDSDRCAALQAQYERQRHFALACIRPPPPILLICHGFSGSGKSMLAAQLAEKLPALHLRSDLERKRLSGMAATADSGSQLQRGIYTQNHTERTYRYLAEKAEELLLANFSVIVDATFIQRRYRDLLRETARSCNARFVILDVHAEEATLRRRIEQRALARTDPSEADTRVLDSQLRNHQPLSAQERATALSVDGEYGDCEKLIAALVDRLTTTA